MLRIKKNKKSPFNVIRKEGYDPNYPPLVQYCSSVFKKRGAETRVKTLDKLHKAYLPVNMKDTFNKIYLPVSVDNFHWVLIVICPSKEMIYYFDSLSPSTHNLTMYLDAVQKWILDWGLGDKHFKIKQAGSPVQEDGFNCGLFMLANAICVTNGVETNSYNSSSLSNFRSRIKKDIRNGEIPATLNECLGIREELPVLPIEEENYF